MKYVLTPLVLLSVAGVLRSNGFVQSNEAWIGWDKMDRNESQEIGFGKKVDVLQTAMSSIPVDIKDLMEGVELKGKRVYRIGQRKDGDRLVAEGSKKEHFPTPHNVAITLKYPTSGPGATVTFVYCEVIQKSHSGRVYVKDGGIGQHSITFVIEAYKTNFINWTCQVYGI